ncbi:hypothetical protein Celaphus_00011761, partial [Cervus elaphus hippelaphus]
EQAIEVKNHKKVVLFFLRKDKKVLWEEGQEILVGSVDQADDDYAPTYMIYARSKDPINKKLKGIKHEL